ncbi:hypothetical protein Val02_52570 [Virgisporangium aliadipatigenens]|uniref:Thioesterase domain-containing protein n=1 Tax=Virgisporangium aliadipatigenens TaxID=741659 RepID=A0A8J4DSP1_9ACTN|nr:hypothetical protein [Virgisporangium aliadipatigenens]GIJ48371.1 hypothetical protein Val02_52570 [Virgisporangium aliadipatigenens]
MSDIEINGWTRISGNGTGGTVLAVDFDGSGRKEATFRDLVRLLPDDLDVWHAVPPAEAGKPQDYLDRWRTPPGAPVHAILGYCAGSVYACALADLVEADTGTRPPVVLFNPGLPTVDTLDRDFGGIVEGMTVLTDEERQALRDGARAAREAHGDDFDAVSAEYLAMYLTACDTAFERYGIPPDVGEQLTGLFRAYVTYLSAAREVELRPAWAHASALTAREQAGLGFVPGERVFPLTRAELLRDREVATMALALIATGDGVPR